MIIKKFDQSQFHELKPYWKKLDCGSEMTIFQSYEWYEWLNQSYDLESTKNHFRDWIYILCVDDSGVPLMIAPVQIVKYGLFLKGVGLKKGAYFIGRKGYSDYLNFIYDSFNGDVIKMVLDYIKINYSINFCQFENVLENTSFSKYLRMKYDIKNPIKGECAALFFPNSLDEYKASLKKHAKQNIRTALNRQKRNGLCLSYQVLYDVDSGLQQKLWSIREQRLKDKRKKAIKKITSKLYNWARDNFVVRFNAHMNIFECKMDEWCFLVKNNDQEIGFFWGIRDVHRKSYYVILAGVDKEYSWYSPSISSLYLWICELYDTGNEDIRVLDFTVGNERYKTDIGGTVNYIERLSFDI